jgi:hypothetical protein
VRKRPRKLEWIFVSARTLTSKSETRADSGGQSKPDPSRVLVLSPVAEYFAPERLKRLEHEIFSSKRARSCLGCSADRHCSSLLVEGKELMSESFSQYPVPDGEVSAPEATRTLSPSRQAEQREYPSANRCELTTNSRFFKML